MTVYLDKAKYSDSHEWVLVEGDIATIGISDHAQSLLGEIVFIELPTIGSNVVACEELGVLESVKSASDIYSPISGEVIELNELLDESPNLLNDDPYEKGWLVKLKITNPIELENLMTKEQYANCLEG